MFHRLLVPLDGTKEAEAILPLAKALLESTSSQLLLVHVVGEGKKKVQEGEKYLKRTTRRIHKGAVRTAVSSGPPDSQIITEATRLLADGIALSSSTLSKGLGSVAKRIVERSKVPVVVWVRGRSKKPVSHRPKRFLVPLDGTEESEGVLGIAASLLGRKDTKVTLLRVGMKSYWSLGGLPGSPSIATSRLQGYLGKCADRLGHPGRVRCLVRRGDPIETILGEARTHDMVVMASHHRTGISKLIHGSVAQELLELVPVPMLVA
ncbi:MAG: universal stress protein [Planctomycetota bacterium]|jgi:nucleotide-binding universal stress UspA family protein